MGVNVFSEMFFEPGFRSSGARTRLLNARISAVGGSSSCHSSHAAQRKPFRIA
jgi:hypothetical protein